MQVPSSRGTLDEERRRFRCTVSVDFQTAWRPSEGRARTARLRLRKAPHWASGAASSGHFRSSSVGLPRGKPRWFVTCFRAASAGYYSSMDGAELRAALEERLGALAIRTEVVEHPEVRGCCRRGGLRCGVSRVRP